jgi:hypothetical protein
MSDERQPDQREDPRGPDTGQGYPEEQPGGAQPEPGNDGSDVGPEADTEPPPAPTTDGNGRDSGPGIATGNPNAAG